MGPLHLVWCKNAHHCDMAKCSVLATIIGAMATRWLSVSSVPNDTWQEAAQGNKWVLIYIQFPASDINLYQISSVAMIYFYYQETIFRWCNTTYTCIFILLYEKNIEYVVLFVCCINVVWILIISWMYVAWNFVVLTVNSCCLLLISVWRTKKYLLW